MISTCPGVCDCYDKLLIGAPRLTEFLVPVYVEELPRGRHKRCRCDEGSTGCLGVCGHLVCFLWENWGRVDAARRAYARKFMVRAASSRIHKS
jgi:hypothetical protein